MSPRERELLLDAFDSNWIAPLGPHVNEFEKEFAEAVQMPYAAALASGTSALHLSLLMHDVQPGDDVVTSTLTFVATANAIKYCGANPVFLDSDWETWNLDPNLLEEELKEAKQANRMPKAVLAVDVNGQCADYDAIEEICDRFEVPLIEDAAESLGARYKERSAGSFGRAGIFSFNGNKIITTSGGGMMVSNDKDLIDKARFLATQARDPFPHYEHSHVGYNYRMSNLLAAVGRGQLSVLSDRVESRRRNFDFYKQQLGELDGIAFMPEPEGYYSTRWLTALKIDAEKFGVSREDLRLALEQENIESRPIWKPMHMQPVFADCRSRCRAVSETLFNDGLCLPSGSAMTEDQLRRVVSIIHSCRESALSRK